MNNNEILSSGRIKAELKDKRLSVVKEITGLSYPTIKNLADGKELNYTLGTLKAISEYVLESKKDKF